MVCFLIRANITCFFSIMRSALLMGQKVGAMQSAWTWFIGSNCLMRSRHTEMVTSGQVPQLWIARTVLASKAAKTRQLLPFTPSRTGRNFIRQQLSAWTREELLLTFRRGSQLYLIKDLVRKNVTPKFSGTRTAK